MQCSIVAWTQGLMQSPNWLTWLIITNSTLYLPRYPLHTQLKFLWLYCPYFLYTAFHCQVRMWIHLCPKSTIFIFIRLYLWGLMIHSSKGILESTKCHTYGLRSYSIPQTSNLYLHLNQYICALLCPLPSWVAIAPCRSHLNLARCKSRSVLQLMVGDRGHFWCCTMYSTQVGGPLNLNLASLY